MDLGWSCPLTIGRRRIHRVSRLESKTRLSLLVLMSTKEERLPSDDQATYMVVPVDVNLQELSDM